MVNHAVSNGIFVLCNNEWIKLKTESSLVFNGEDASLIEDSEAVYITGALTDRFLNLVSQKKGTLLPEVIVKDFTKIFVSEPILRNFSKRGGKIKVLSKSSLIAVCVNPLSPAGFKLDSDTLCKELSDKIELPVYDIVKNGYEAIEESGKPDGEMRITTETADGEIRVRVRDNGTGIKEENLQNIFKFGFSTKKESGKGTGLGLHSVKTILSKYGGDITIESVYGEWTEFILKFPGTRGNIKEKESNV